MSTVEIVLFECGQGNCALVQSNGKSALIDARVTSEDSEVDLIPKIQKLLGDRALDYLIVSHPHKDHIEGIGKLFKKIDVTCLVDPGLRIDTTAEDGDYSHYEAFIAEVDKRKKKSSEYKLAIRDTVISVGDATLTFLTPDKDYRDDYLDSPGMNQRSAVIRVELAVGSSSRSVLFLADALRATFEDDLPAKYDKYLPSDVIVAAHHASKGFFYYATDKDCKLDPYTDHLDAMDPEYVFVSCNPDECGKNDPPHEAAIKLYKKKGEVHRSDEDGAAKVTLREANGKVAFDFDGEWTPVTKASASAGGAITNQSVPIFTPRPKGRQ